MLQQMRDAQAWMIKGVLWAVVLAFVVTIFYSWGVRSSTGPTRSEVATIFGQPVSLQQFQRTQNALYQSYRQIFQHQTNFDIREHFNFRQMAIEQLVREALLLRVAQQNDLQVTDRELYEHIATVPAFQEQGRFDPQRYETILRSQVPPIPPQQFEVEQRQQLLQAKVHALVRQSIQVTEQATEAAYRHDHEQVAVRYAILVPSLFEAEVTVTDEAIQTYYETHKDTYREPEQRQLRYVTVSPQRFVHDRDFSPQEIAAYYDSHPEAFQRQEQMRVRHILFKVGTHASPEQIEDVRQRATAVLARLRDGADFATEAQQHSEDTATTEAGGDLGYFPRGQMVKPFEDAAFSLSVGQLSDLVRTPYGFHILRAEDKLEAGLPPLAEVEQDVVAKLREEQAQEEAIKFVDDFVIALEAEPQNFEELATRQSLTVETSPLVPPGGHIPGIEGAPEVVRRVFTLEEGAIDTIQSSDGRHYVLQIAAIRPPTLPELTAVRERVVQDLRSQEAMVLTRQRADEWAERVQAGTPLQELAASLHVQLQDTGRFKRQEAIPQIGRLEAFSQTAFGLGVGQTAAVHDTRRAFVLQLTARQPADMTAYEKEKADFRRTLLEGRRQQALQAFQSNLNRQYQTLRDQGEIRVNDQYVF